MNKLLAALLLCSAASAQIPKSDPCPPFGAPLSLSDPRECHERYAVAGTVASDGTEVIPPDPPNAPSDLSANAVSATQIDLTWTDNSDDETGFRVLRCETAGCLPITGVGTAAADATGYSDMAVVADTTYRYAVRAFDGEGESAISNVAEETTPAEAGGIVTDSLVAFYEFDEDGDQTLVDSGPNSYNLTRGATSGADGDDFTWLDPTGGDFVFDDQAWGAGPEQDLEGLSAWSVSFWAYSDAYFGTRCVFSVRNGTNGTQALNIYPHNTSGGNGIRIWLSNTNIFDQNNAGSGDPNLADNNWHHYCVVQTNATTRKVIVDGSTELSGTLTNSASMPATMTNTNIGNWYDTQQRFYRGIDDVAVYSDALSDAECAQNFSAGH